MQEMWNGLCKHASRTRSYQLDPAYSPHVVNQSSLLQITCITSESRKNLIKIEGFAIISKNASLTGHVVSKSGQCRCVTVCAISYNLKDCMLQHGIAGLGIEGGVMGIHM